MVTTISLDAKEYVLSRSKGKSAIRQIKKEAIAEIFRDQNTVGLKQIGPRDAIVYGPFNEGFGRDRIDDTVVHSFLDSTMETHWGDIRLAILEDDNTEGGAAEAVKDMEVYKGSLHELIETDTGEDISVRVMSGTTWGTNALVHGNIGTPQAIGLSLKTHKNRLLALYINQRSHTVKYITSVGGAWTSPTTTAITLNLMDDDVTANEVLDAGLLESIGGEIVAVLWDETSGTITFFSSSDGGDTWADESVSTDVDIASGNGPQGVAVYQGADGENKLYVGTQEGLHEVDVSETVWTHRKIFDMPAHTDNCRRMVVHNDSLYFSQGVSNNDSAIIHRLNTRGGDDNFLPPDDNGSWGLDRYDGVVSDLQGPIQFMESSGQWLFISIGGGASGKKARILRSRKPPFWHFAYQNTTENEKITVLGIDGDRIHWNEKTGAASYSTKSLSNIFTNPNTSGNTINRQPSGILDLPRVNAGMPTITNTWLRVIMNARSLGTTSQEKFILTHGIGTFNSEAARTATALGEIIAGTPSQQYASGNGTIGLSDALRIDARQRSGGTTQTPIGQSIEHRYITQIPDIRAYEMVIDIQATAVLRGGNSAPYPAKIITTDLDTARSKEQLLDFAFGEVDSNDAAITRKVRITSLEWDEDMSEIGGSGVAIAANTARQLGGTILLRVEEVEDISGSVNS